MPKWAKWLIGGAVVVGTIATAILTGGASMAVGAAIGATVGAGLGILSGVTFDANGKLIFDWDRAASGFMFGAITGAISGASSAHFAKVIKSDMLGRSIRSLVDGALSLGVYYGQALVDGNMKDITLQGSLISFGTGLLNFCDPLDNWMDYIWSPIVGAEISWGYDILSEVKR